jgi:hypothetical protein
MKARGHSVDFSDPGQLALLLSQEEGATLEFKREWYRLGADPKEKEYQKVELIKDILSLANGNAETAGETAVMIVGAASERREDGSRVVFDVGESIPTAAQILEIVRAVSSPPMDSIQVVPFRHNEATLFAVVIAPTPHVYEITKTLKWDSHSFSKYSVFIRRGDSVDLASSRERDAIATLKRIRLSEVRNPPPVSFGGAVGATIGGILIGQISSRKGGIGGAVGGGLAGGILGGTFGVLMGISYEALFQQTSAWRQPPARRRGIVMALVATLVTGTWILSDKIGDMVVGSTQRRDGSAKEGAQQLAAPEPAGVR